MRRTYRAPRRRRLLIAPKAVQAFLDRKLDDWRWIKQVSREELEQFVPKGFAFPTTPRLHQLVCFVLSQRFPRFLFLLDMGSGKSKIVLDAIRYRKHQGELRCALIVVPHIINLESWEQQIKRHAPDLTYRILRGNRTKRYTVMDEVASGAVDVCVINYGGLQTFMATGERTVRGKKRRGMVREDAADFASAFNFVDFDEPHLYLSTHRSISYTLADYLSAQADFVYANTGTPFDKNPTKAWSQFHVVDRGETLGESLGMFQAAYFMEKAHHFKGFDYVFDKSKWRKLNQTLQHRSIRYEDSELADLPAVSFNSIPVLMTDAQLEHYQTILDQANEARLSGEREASYIRLRQCVAGFISVKGADDQRVQVAFKPNGKALALEQYLLALPDDEKVTIFHEFVPSGNIIREVLGDLKIKFTGVGHGFKDGALNLRKFMTDPFMRVWLANWKAGGTGADGLQQVCRYGLFYETPSSPSNRRQCWKRLSRDGQLRRVYITDLVAANVNIDKRIHKGIKQGIDMFEALVSGKERL